MLSNFKSKTIGQTNTINTETQTASLPPSVPQSIVDKKKPVSSTQITFNIEDVRKQLKQNLRNKCIRREHDVSELKTRFSITELSQCLFKVFLRRVGKLLHKHGLYTIDTSKINPFSDLHMTKGNSIHKMVQQEIIEYYKEQGVEVISEKYFYVDKYGGIGGKPDLFFPQQNLLIDIKTGTVPKTHKDLYSPDMLAYTLQMYLLTWVLRNNGYESLDTCYLWFLPVDSVIEIPYVPTHVENFLHRVSLLRDLIQLVSKDDESTQIDIEQFRSIVKENISIVEQLLERSFCRYCVLVYTCSKVLAMLYDGQVKNNNTSHVQNNSIYSGTKSGIIIPRKHVDDVQLTIHV